MKNNIVISAALGYNKEQLSNFINSLRINFSSRVHLFISETNDFELLKFLEINNISFTLIADADNAAVNRYFYLQQYLLNIDINQINEIFWTDSRDVYFQQDPFIINLKDNIEYYAEPELIINCPVNSKWILHLYGDSFYDKIKNKLIICSGTTRGKASFFINYVNSMCTEILRLRSFNILVQGGHDQAVHNYLIHNNLVSGVIIQNGTSTLQTIHYQKTLIFNRDGFLLNTDNKICPVIHQYDRIYMKFKPFNSKLRVPNNIICRNSNFVDFSKKVRSYFNIQL